MQIIKTEDGSDTLYVPELDEHYHSVHGAVTESKVIFINAGFDSCRAEPVHILEIGFGTGLNALLTAIKARTDKRLVYYSAIENYPLPENILNSLNYVDLIPGCERDVFDRIHSCKWNVFEKINENFRLCKIRKDLITDDITGKYDLVYFDAFGPDKQPEIWSEKVFNKISDCTFLNSILVTYSAKGDIKRRLKKFGFEVHLLPGPPGKRHIIRAVKI